MKSEIYTKPVQNLTVYSLRFTVHRSQFSTVYCYLSNLHSNKTLTIKLTDLAISHEIIKIHNAIMLYASHTFRKQKLFAILEQV